MSNRLFRTNKITGLFVRSRLHIRLRRHIRRDGFFIVIIIYTVIDFFIRRRPYKINKVIGISRDRGAIFLIVGVGCKRICKRACFPLEISMLKLRDYIFLIDRSGTFVKPGGIHGNGLIHRGNFVFVEIDRNLFPRIFFHFNFRGGCRIGLRHRLFGFDILLAGNILGRFGLHILDDKIRGIHNSDFPGIFKLTFRENCVRCGFLEIVVYVNNLRLRIFTCRFRFTDCSFSFILLSAEFCHIVQTVNLFFEKSLEHRGKTAHKTVCLFLGFSRINRGGNGSGSCS